MNILGLTIILPSGTVIVNRILMAIITIFGVMMNKKLYANPREMLSFTFC